MTRQEQREEKLRKEQEFIDSEEKLEALCFDKNSIWFRKMIKILHNAKSRVVKPEYGYELHHKIPRAYFKATKNKVVDGPNLYKLTYAEHFLVHYYAYLCAKPLIKRGMTYALRLMKLMCTKNDGCTEANIYDLSNLINSVKLEIHKSSKENSISYYTKKINEKTNQFAIVTKINVKDSVFKLRCLYCGCEFNRSIIPFLEGSMKCPNCRFGDSYRTSVNALWFGINKNNKKSEWTIQHISYTPSMKLSNSFITPEYIKQHPPIVDKWWVKKTLIDYKPDNESWELDESKRLKRDVKDINEISNVYEQENLIRFLWERKDVSNNFIYKYTTCSSKTIMKRLKLDEREFNNTTLYSIKEFPEHGNMSKIEWEKTLNMSWYKINNNYTVYRKMPFEEFIKSFENIYLSNSEFMDILVEVIPFAVSNGITDEEEIYELIIDAYKYIYDVRDFKD